MGLASTFDESWVDIFCISNELLLCASSGDWDKTITLSKKRHKKIEEHFQDFPISAENALLNQKNMENFTEIENKLQAAITLEKENLIIKSKNLRTYKKGVDTYQLSLL